MKKRKFLIVMLVLAMVLASVLTAYGAIPEPSSGFYVADYADVIAPDTEEYIINQNGQLESLCDGAQIVVVAVDFLDGMDIEDYCYKLFNDWQIGGTANNGVLLLLTIGEENYWCMTGKGLENKLTAGEIDDILWYNLEDYFAAGDYDSGVRVTFDVLYNELCNVYGVSSTPGTDDYYGDGYYGDDYYGESLTTMDWIITLITLIIFIMAVIFIFKLIRRILRSLSAPQPYRPYTPPRPVIIRPARRIYIPTPVHRPYVQRKPYTPVPPHRPYIPPASAAPRTFTSPGRSSFGSTKSSSSFGGSFGGGSSRSRGIGRGGGGMSRGGGAGRRGR